MARLLLLRDLPVSRAITPHIGLRCPLSKPRETQLSEPVSYRYRHHQGLQTQTASPYPLFVAHPSKPYH